MSKTATIRTRIEPCLKNEVEDILSWITHENQSSGLVAP